MITLFLLGSSSVAINSRHRLLRLICAGSEVSYNLNLRADSFLKDLPICESLKLKQIIVNLMVARGSNSQKDLNCNICAAYRLAWDLAHLDL